MIIRNVSRAPNQHQDHVALETTVMAAENSALYSRTGINNILKDIKIGNGYFNC